MLRHMTSKKSDRSLAAVILGRKGGTNRMKKLTPEERSALGRKGGLMGGKGRPKKKSDQAA
jgi:general stress protein YciG